MKKIISRIAPLICAVILVFTLSFPRSVHAAGNILYVTPNSSQLNVNGSVTLNVRAYAESSGATGSVSGSLTYPANLFRVTATSAANSGYQNPSISVNSGSIAFSGTQNPGQSGTIQIFTVTFQAIASGTAIVGFTGSSSVNQSGTNLSTGTFTITAPTPAPTPTPTPTPTPAPTPTPTPTPTPAPTPTPTPETTTDATSDTATTPDSTGLINNVYLTPRYSTATVTWKINGKNDATDLQYGTSSDKLTTKATGSKGSDGVFTAVLTNLSPGVRYYFVINATSDDGKAAVFNSSVTTVGYPVTLQIKEGGQPSTTAKIKIGQQTYATTKDGTVTIQLAEGAYTGQVTTDTAPESADFSFTVAKKTIPEDGEAPEKQTFSFDVPASQVASGSSFSIFAFVGVIVIGILILAVAFFVFVTIKRKRYETGAGYTNKGSTTSVVIDDGYDWRADQIANGQTTEVTDSSPIPPLTIPIESDLHPHENSVYIDEEEPKDMFELAKEQSQTAPTPSDVVSNKPTSKNQPGWPQNPNLPHSTKP